MSNYFIDTDGELYHHGIKGQKWGVRRYQNSDGTLTVAGKKRYITNAEAKANARNAAKKSIENDRAEGTTIYRAHRNARQARLDSIAADKAYNRKLKEEKKQAKGEYKQAKRSAYDEYEKTVKKANDQYEKDMAGKNAELAKVNKRYDVKDVETKRYYDGEIEKCQKQAAEAKRDMDAWSGLSDTFYEEAKSRYNESVKAVKNLETQRDGALYANSVARANANIKVNELFYDSSTKAENTKAAAYVQAGKDYANSVKLAKQKYEEYKRL